MLIKVKGYSYASGTISIELTKNDTTSLSLPNNSMPVKEVFKLQRISGEELLNVAIISADYETGSAPVNFNGLFKLTFEKTNILGGDILILGGTDESIAPPFERIYNTVTVDGGLSTISENAVTTITMVAPNHNHTDEKQYNLVINTLTEDGVASEPMVVQLAQNLVVNGIAVGSVKLTKVPTKNNFVKGEKINFTVTFHSDIAGGSPPLNFDGDVNDYLAVAFDYKM